MAELAPVIEVVMDADDDSASSPAFEESQSDRHPLQHGVEQRAIARPEAVVCAQCATLVDVECRRCSRCQARRPDTGWPSVEDEDDPWLGCVIDQTYRVIGLIGVGSMGRVYEAESTRIARSFAVKLVDPGAGSSPEIPERVYDRLQREIEAQAILQNPHIVSLIDAMLLPGGHIAMVMDLIDGQTLSELIHEHGPMPIERACGIIRQAANGLEEAHKAGLVHRDLKPENIMVEVLPAGDDFVHICDFGVVFESDLVVEDQVFVGTPLFASPEQVCGESLDGRSDIYSLGAVFFCMLTGRPPYVTDEVTEALDAHINAPIPTLNQAISSRVFPDRLEGLVSRMLAKRRAERPDSMTQLIAELDGLAAELGPQPTLAPDSSSLEERSNSPTVVPEAGDASSDALQVRERDSEPTQPSCAGADESIPEAQVLIAANCATDDDCETDDD
jgi:eukaryotic-like serine/threonine-protein kinase